jgi:transposase
LKEDLKLSDRVYNCDCGISIDRDLNASINLRNKFLIDMSVEYIDYRRGETIRPVRIIYDPKGSFREVSTTNYRNCA